MKGVFEDRPVFPKYKLIWDVQILLNYFRTLPSPTALTLELLGKKLALLIGILAGGHRFQTLHAINVLDIKIVGKKCVIPIYENLKQSKPGKHLKPLEFTVYLTEPKLCVVSNLKEYLAKTFPLRKHPQLFLSYVKPHKPISKDCVQMVSGGYGKGRYRYKYV